MSNPSPEDLLERARALRPVLSERASETERLRCLPKASLDDLVAAGFFSILAPRRFGGFEMELGVLLDVARELGRGCGSTAWVLALLGIHNWLAAFYPEEAQAEMFGDAPYVLAPATFAPGGRAVPADGGFRVTGQWSFGSGSRHGSWAMVSAVVVGDGASSGPDVRCVAIPMSEVRVEDTWHTAGMRGTGSNDLHVDDVFVPERRAISFLGLLEGRKNGPVLQRLPLIPVLSHVASAPALGIARCAVDAFRERLDVRRGMDGSSARDKPAAQMRLAEATIEVATAEDWVRRGVAELGAVSASGAQLSIADRARFRMQAGYAAKLCRQAVDRVVEAAGARAQFQASPLQRCQRDIHTLMGHVVFDFDETTELYGRVLLGLPPSAPMV